MTPADEFRQAAALWERLLAAMEGECSACGGSGRIVNGAWQGWYARSNELVRVAQVARRAAGLPPDRRVTIITDTGGFPRIDPAVAPQIEAPAVVVAAERAIDEHQNTRPHEPEQMMCSACQGQGRALTVIGSQVADLFTRHGFLRRPPAGPPPGRPTGQFAGQSGGHSGGQPAGQPAGYGAGGYDTGTYDTGGYDQGGYDTRGYDRPSHDPGPPDTRAYDGGPYREPY